MSLISHPDDLGELGEQELEELYSWIDGIPLTKPKRNISRDFSDGVLVAEVIKHKFPRIVDVHNYSPANATPKKIQNWLLLNKKVFKQLNFELSLEVVKQICNAKPGLIERVLFMLRTRLERLTWDQQQYQKQGVHSYDNDRPEADQLLQAKYSTPRKEGKLPRPVVKAGIGGQVIKSPKDSAEEMVPLLLVEEKEQEVLAKNETILILQAKIKRLEHLLHLKDIRIEDLQNRLEKARATGRK